MARLPTNSSIKPLVAVDINRAQSRRGMWKGGSQAEDGARQEVAVACWQGGGLALSAGPPLLVLQPWQPLSAALVWVQALRSLSGAVLCCVVAAHVLVDAYRIGRPKLPGHHDVDDEETINYMNQRHWQALEGLLWAGVVAAGRGMFLLAAPYSWGPHVHLIC
jgi:hypothetical protein